MIGSMVYYALFHFGMEDRSFIEHRGVIRAYQALVDMLNIKSHVFPNCMYCRYFQLYKFTDTHPRLYIYAILIVIPTRNFKSYN